MSDGDVVIRLRDVYDISRRTEQKVDLLVLGFDTAQRTAADHETRLRAVERRVWAIPTVSTIIAALALTVSVVGVVTGRW